MRQNGEFSTVNEQLQKAMEDSRGFNKVYKLSKTFGFKEEKSIQKEELNLQEKVCSTVNEAIEWLIDLGCKKSEVNTSAKAIAIARELGYNLKFERGE